MKIAFSQEQLFDIVGYPLVAGRVKFYLHDSDTLANTYTMDGNAFIEAQNPVILTDTGEFSSTIFLEAAIYDVVVDQLVDGTYAQIKDFQYGFDYPSVKNDTIVQGMAGLADANPELGSVTVVGYDSNVSAGPRTYIWDGNCTDNADGGAIVESNSTLNGRWILCSDLREMPCSYYGIAPGHEGNVSAFLTYLPIVGTYNIVMPPVPRFSKGTYSSVGTFSVTKTISFDPGVKFTNATFNCPNVEVTQLGNYVADFAFSKATEAHSSWFRSVDSFWHCGAKVLVVDNDNYFTNSQLSHAVNLSNTTVVGNGTAVSAYVNGAYFQIALSTEIPDRFFARTDYVRIGVQNVGDRIFRTAGQWDPGMIGAGHHQQYDYEPNLATFDSADNWLDVMLERRERMTAQVWNQYELDLEGRTVGSFVLPVGSFNEIRNAVVDGHITVKGALTLYGCKADILTDGSAVAVDAFDSELRFLQNGIGLGSANLVDCRTTFQYTINPADTAVSVVGGTFSGKVWLADGNANAYDMNKSLIFRNVNIGGNQVWRANYISMEGCVGSVKLDVLPYYNSDTYYYWNVVLIGNHYVGNSRVWFTVYATEDNPHIDMDGKVKMGFVRIVDNRFDTSDVYGIKQLHWHPYTHNGLLADGSAWEYHGNAGTCPRLNPGFIPNEGKWPDTQGSSTRWRIYDGTFNLWAPYNTYSDGSVHAAVEPTGLNPYLANAMYALLITPSVASEPIHEIWGVRTYYAVSDIMGNMWDENMNNTFVCKLAMGDGISAVPTFDTGVTYFPGLATI